MLFRKSYMVFDVAFYTSLRLYSEFVVLSTLLDFIVVRIVKFKAIVDN